MQRHRPPHPSRQRPVAGGSCDLRCPLSQAHHAGLLAQAQDLDKSTGHESRLKRDLGGAFGKPRHAGNELVAELDAVLLGDRLENGSENESHAACLVTWIELLKNHPTCFSRCSARCGRRRI
ncbi:zincin-like metallopeptidase domain-containing protein [Synechococcus sp. CS-1328]|uniref:zincin-like metallopeptidase domain-containing protein n=1 Tax=Synechococcus sp. CS-1328 TaxID=2847976 RepID=UPI002880171E|nr:zincin-like metallopeptidase domain-containing protein [Synechococcus sp. CS-1328]